MIILDLSVYSRDRINQVLISPRGERGSFPDATVRVKTKEKEMRILRGRDGRKAEEGESRERYT